MAECLADRTDAVAPESVGKRDDSLAGSERIAENHLLGVIGADHRAAPVEHHRGIAVFGPDAEAEFGRLTCQNHVAVLLRQRPQTGHDESAMLECLRPGRAERIDVEDVHEDEGKPAVARDVHRCHGDDVLRRLAERPRRVDEHHFGADAVHRPCDHVALGQTLEIESARTAESASREVRHLDIRRVAVALAADAADKGAEGIAGGDVHPVLSVLITNRNCRHVPLQSFKLLWKSQRSLYSNRMKKEQGSPNLLQSQPSSRMAHLYMNESLAFHLLNCLPGCGAKTIRLLVGTFGSAQAAWEAPDSGWEALGQPRLMAMALSRKSLDPGAESEKLAKSSIEVFPFTGTLFPALLTEIPDPPALLYVRGSFREWNERPLLAIVGSRKFTSYGKQVATELTRALSQAGYVIVTGLAFGIDSIAHEATLEADGTTLAILGSGIDDRSISPQSHLRLAQEIMGHGALLSELAPGANATVGTFPARNRIMAGLCQGVIVIEAAEDSGSLITARLALDYNREVFAVPGSIFSPTSIGTHRLLKDGARLVTGVQDILEELAPGKPVMGWVEAMPIDLDPDENRIYQALSHEGLHIDNLIAPLDWRRCRCT